MNALALILTVALGLATLAFLVLHIRLRKRVAALETNLNENYWTKQTVARNYGEPPADKLEAEKRQDEQLKNLGKVKI
jgi:hypothetical protein